MLLKLVPEHTNIQFTNFRFIAAGVSALLMVASIIAVATLGLNFGVDFRGGVTIEIADEQPLKIEEVRAAVAPLDLGEIKVQEVRDLSGAVEGIVIIVEQQAGGEDAADAPASEPAAPTATNETATAQAKVEESGDLAETAQQRAATAVREAITATFGDSIDFRKIDVVGPAVSGELVQSGITAVVISIIFMLGYIWFRFEWQFSIGAIMALVHDVVITLGIFAVTRLEFSLAIIAAILTIVGYSMNDTVVVYDRVRENLRKFKKKPLREVIDLSVNDTLSRTVMTSVTTLLALVALYVIGGEVLRGFTFAMIWGVLIGTYSSVFVASPILLATGVKRDWSSNATEVAPA